jgi:hypothetical protein
MEKSTAVKSIRRCAAAFTLLLALAVAAAPYAQAKYISSVEIDTGISGVSNSDLNALLIQVLEERYPPGSIYMTTVEDGYPDVGDWSPWAQGRVPVGVNFDNLEDVVHWAAPNETGGSVGSGGEANATVAISGNVTGSATLNPKTVAYKDGSLVFDATPQKVTLQGPAKFQSDPFTLENKHMPGHTHAVTDMSVTHGQAPQGTSGCPGNNNHSLSDVGTGGSGTTTWPARSEQTLEAARNAQRWGVFIHHKGGGEITVDIPLTVSGFSATLTNPAATLNHPTFSVTPQTVGAVSRTFGGSKSAVVADETVQPFITCYMYVRTG